VQLTTPEVGAAGDTDAVWRPHSGQVLYIKWSILAQTFQPYSQLEINDTVTRASWALTPVGGRVIQPAWSPDGRRVAYIRRTPAGVDQVVVAAVRHSAHGPVLGSRTVLAVGAVAQPAFTPDGRWVTYLQVAGDAFRLWAAPSRGGVQHPVAGVDTSLDARWRPTWMP
jgi:Tol biopolymer transport system component